MAYTETFSFEVWHRLVWIYLRWFSQMATPTSADTFTALATPSYSGKLVFLKQLNKFSLVAIRRKPSGFSYVLSGGLKWGLKQLLFTKIIRKNA
jgi:hypothetical protein